MTSESSMTLIEYLSKVGIDPDGDFLQEGARLLAQMAMELEVTQQIGAGKYERSAERMTQRNGYRERAWDTRVGTLALQIPKLRQGSYFPSLLEPRRRAEQALLAVVQQAYIDGVSTRKVDALVQALGLDGIDKSQVSRTCRELDELVREFRTRPLEQTYPYLWLDALTSRCGKTTASSVRRWWWPSGCARRASGKCWAWRWGQARAGRSGWSSCAAWCAAGLKGVQLVTSDSHEGLKAAIARC